MANNPRWARMSADANAARARQAGREQAALAAGALEVLRERSPAAAHVQRWMKALRHRVEHPDATLTELGQTMTPSMTKHAYAALLRRALRGAGSYDDQLPADPAEGTDLC